MEDLQGAMEDRDSWRERKSGKSALASWLDDDDDDIMQDTLNLLNLFVFSQVWHKARSMERLVRIELTNKCLLAMFTNNYIMQGTINLPSLA